MACSTLKRPYSDALTSPNGGGGVSGDGTPNFLPQKRPRFSPLHNPHGHHTSTSTTTHPSPSSSSSPFSGEMHSPPRGGGDPGRVSPMNPLISARLAEEFHALRRRRKLSYDKGDKQREDQGLDKDKQPLFTFDQANMIFQRLLKEREEELKDMYQKELHLRLSEQYGQFIRFTQDQIKNSFVNAPTGSYFS